MRRARRTRDALRKLPIRGATWQTYRLIRAGPGAGQAKAVPNSVVSPTVHLHYCCLLLVSWKRNANNKILRLVSKLRFT